MKKLQVFGPGCHRCKTLEENVRAAVAQLGLEAEIVKIDDIYQMLQMGIASTPALVVDGAVVSTGKVLTVNEVRVILT